MPSVSLEERLRRGVRERRKALRVAVRQRNAEERLLPDYLIIGAQKAGTTSLHAYLAAHPDVGDPVTKEVHYFDIASERGIEWYRAHFPLRSEARLAGESTPYYLFHPAVPARVKAQLPEAKLIVLLRDPVERAFSHYNYEVSLGYEDAPDFATALGLEQERLAGEHERILRDPGYRSFNHQHYAYLTRGYYAEQLERWLEHFPQEQLLVLSSDDLFTDPGGTVARVQGWLGMSEHIPSSLTPKTTGSYAPLDPELRARLTAGFEADGRRLEELVGFSPPWL